MENDRLKELSVCVCVILLLVLVLLSTRSVFAQPSPNSKPIVRCPIKIESPLLAKSELVDQVALAIKLRDRQDLVSQFLRTQLSSETQQLLIQIRNGSAPPELADALVAELNRVLRGPSIFTAERFAGISLSQELQDLMNSNPAGEELILLNRLLLEAAYSTEIAKDMNRPVPKGLTIRSVKVTGRRGVGPIEDDLKSLLVGKTYTADLHRQAVRKVSDELTNEVNQSFEDELGIEGGAHVDRRTGAAFLYITQCVEIDKSSKSVDVIVRVIFLRADLRNLASNILPLPRSLQPSFYDKMPALLRAFSPMFTVAHDRRFGPAPSLKLATNLLALKPLIKAEEISDPNTHLDFDFAGQKSLKNRFYQTATDIDFSRERPGNLLERFSFAGSFNANDQPLTDMRETNNGVHISGEIKLRPRIGMLNSVLLQGKYDRALNKVFDRSGLRLGQRDNTGSFRGIIDGRVWDGFSRLGIWFETTDVSKSSLNYKRLAGLAGFQKEFGAGTQTVGFEAVVGGGKAWGDVPFYARFFGGNNSGSFLYDSADSPTMDFPVGPLLRSYGMAQATVPAAAVNNTGGTSYWHANLNLTIPVRAWSSRLIPDEEVDVEGQTIKLNKLLENFTIKSAKNTLTDQLMDDIIVELMKNDPNLSEDDATEKALPIAAARADKLVEKEVGPAIRFIARHANLYAVKPMIMLDAAYLRGTSGDRRQRFAVGGGIQLVMIVARAEFGYMRSLPTFARESKGNFVFRLTFQNIF